MFLEPIIYKEGLKGLSNVSLNYTILLEVKRQTSLNCLLTVFVPLDLWLVAVQGRVDDDGAAQAHGLPLSSK